MSGLYIYLYFSRLTLACVYFPGSLAHIIQIRAVHMWENGENGMHTVTAVNLRLSPVCLSIFPCDQGWAFFVSA